MSLPLKSQLDLYNLFLQVLQDKAPNLTDTLDGSIIDGLAGVFSVAGMELQRYNLTEFNKTFIDLATGPVNPGDPDDLQTLAVDHYGDAFARPQATSAIDTATFSRPTTTAGNITILAGTVVKTKPDANGNVQRYTTNSTVTLTGLSVSVGITAVVAGAAGSAVAGAISVIESTLLDSTITVTNTGNQTGADAEDDPTYRETIRFLLTTLRAATKTAIIAAAKTVTGVVVATPIEIEQAVVLWDIGANAPLNSAGVGGLYDYFWLPNVTLYIADRTGSASSSLIAAVSAKLDSIRAYGVRINVQSASPVTVNWSLQLTLNPSGPNYSNFSADTSAIIEVMSNYIATLGAGVSFVRSTAEAYILSVYGSSGTNDMTACHSTVPTGDVSISATQTAIPGTILTV